MFSANEEVTDINTLDLPFLSCFGYIARIYAALRFPLVVSGTADEHVRRTMEVKRIQLKVESLKRAMLFLQEFLGQLMERKLVEKEDRDMIDNITTILDSWKDSQVDGKTSCFIDVKSELNKRNPNQLREFKIGSLRKTRSLLHQLSMMLAAREPASNGEESDEDREVILLQLQKLSTDSINDLLSYSTELNLLSSQLVHLSGTVEDDARKIQGHGSAHFEAQTPAPRELKFVTIGIDMKPTFKVIDNGEVQELNDTKDETFQRIASSVLNFNSLVQRPKTREELEREIYRPSWSQPTMSLDEYAERKMERMTLETERSKAFETQKEEALQQGVHDLKIKEVLQRGLEDNEQIAETAIENDRRWDDWKDDNPKGSGVTKRY